MSDFDPDEFIRKYGGAPTEEEGEEVTPVVPPLPEPEAEKPVEAFEPPTQVEPEAAAEFDPDEFIRKYSGAPKKEPIKGEDYLARQAQYLMSRPPLDEEFVAEPEVEGDGIIRQALDIPINIKVGAIRGVKFMTDIFGADNPVSNALKSYESIFTDLLSAESRQDQETIARIMQEAEDEGILGQIAAGLQAFTVAPLDMTAQAAGTMIPILAAGLVGKVAKLGATGVRALQAGAGGGMGVGVVKSEIYDGVYEYMLSKGVDEEEARRTASQAQAYNGKNLDSILIGGGLGILAASTGAERIVSAVMMKAGGRPTGNLVQRVLKAGFTEAAPESAQGFQEKLAQNLALQREGAEVPLGRGVFANAALEGTAGFGVAAPLGVFKAPMTPQEVAGLAKETQQAASDSKDVAPATADTVEKLADTISVDATVGPLARQEGETDEQYRARIDRIASETPDQRLARLQQEAQAGAEITLEEEPPVSGLPPQPVTPTPEVPAETMTQAFTQMGEGAVDSYYQAVLRSLRERGEVPSPERRSNVGQAWDRVRGTMTPEEFVVQLRQNAEDPSKIQAPVAVEPAVTEVAPEVSENVAAWNQIKTEFASLSEDDVKAGRGQFFAYNPDLKEEANVHDVEKKITVGPKFFEKTEAQRLEIIGHEFSHRLSDSMLKDLSAFDLADEGAFGPKNPETGKLSEGINGQDTPAENIAEAASLIITGSQEDINFLKERYPVALQKITERMIQDGYPVSDVAIAALPPTPEAAPVTPTPVTPTPVTPEVPTAVEPPALAPLRRVVKAEQTEDDVSGLVGQGLVELYKGQPVITQAGLETLPEVERPRLTPEARKIQIDTNTSEAAAEAISKNLRIGVDQVPADVRMPAGWTLVGDVYVPPTPMAKIESFDVEALAEVDEDSDVFADVIKRKDEAKTAVAQKPEGSAFATQDEFRAAFDLRGEGHGRFATRLDLMVADGVITSDGRDLIMAVIYDNNTDDTFLNNMEMGSMRARATRSYGLGGVSRQTVQSAKGKAIGYKPLLKMMQNARRDLQIDEKTAQTLSTFWHEFGHAGYYSLLDKAQKSVVASAYRKTTKAQRIKFFESGVAAARQGDVTAQYYAKSETEWFAQSFAEYVLTQKSEQKALVPIFETILNKIKGVFGKLFSRKEGTPELNDIFEYIIQGKGYGSTKIWWNGLQLSLAPAVYGTRGAQPIDPDFSKRLVEREKQNRARARRSIAPQPEARESRRAIVTPQQDRDYLDAVERGDLDSASRVVEDAAKEAAQREISKSQSTTKTFSVEEKNLKRLYAKWKSFDPSAKTNETLSGLSGFLKSRLGLSIDFGSRAFPEANSQAWEQDISGTYPQLAPWIRLGTLNIGADSELNRAINATPLDIAGEISAEPPAFGTAGWGDLSVGLRNRAIQNSQERLELVDSLQEKYSGVYSDQELLGIADKIYADLQYAMYRNTPIGKSIEERYTRLYEMLNGINIDPIVRDDAGNIIPPSQRFQQGEADIRYNPLGYDITNVVEDIKAGRTDGPLRAVNNVVKEATAFRDRVKAEAERRQRPRARGKAAILERIARERSGGKLSEETARALTDFVNSIREEAIGDTAISIKGAGAASNFDFGQSLVNFFLTQDQPKVGARVGIHEFWHGLSRFLPKTEAEKMASDYTKALGEYLKKNPWFLAFVGRYSLTPEQFEEYKLFNPKEAETKLVPVQDSQGNIVKYQIKYDAENYRYIMLDEWIAEKMTDLVESRQAMPNTFMGKLAKIIKEFLAQIQAKLGRDAYQSFYNLVTDPNQKIDLQRMGGVARPFQIYQPQDYNYAEDISDQIRYAMRQREDINREYAPNTDEERKAFEKATSNKVLARNPQLAVAAVRLKNGQITAGEYADLVDSIDPFVPKGADPIPTDDKIKQYIQSDKVGKVGFFDENGKPRLNAGDEYEFRIDIHTYNKSTAAGDTVYNITAHLPVADDAKSVGTVAAFVGIAKVKDPRFMTRDVREGGAITIATGAGKFRLATVKGNYEPITDLPADINDPNVWTEVGYNPVRSSFFVDTRSKKAVVGGTEAIMVGSRVFVKNAQLEARPTGITYGKAYNPLGLEPEPKPSFVIESPEAKTLSNLKASMEKVDAASEAKGGKPTIQKVSEIAANWMEQGGDERALQDAIVENTNLTPANAARVAKVIAKQYDKQQQIAEAVLETEAGVTLEGLPEGMEIPKDVDPKNKRTVLQRVIDATTGVRVKPVILQVPEKTALKEQIRLKARETREAKKAQQETADAVVEAIKALELRGPMRAKQAQALAKRAAKVLWTSEKSMENFMAYAERVMANTNYDADLREAKAAQKRAKELSKRDSIAAPQRETLEAISNIGINLLNDPREFADVVNHYLRSFKPVASEAYVVVPDAEMKSYLAAAEDVVNDAKAEFEIEDNERLADKYGITIDELKKYMDAEEIMDALVKYAKREVIEGILNEKSAGVKEALKGVDTTILRADQRKLIDSMKVIDVKSLDAAEKQAYIRIGNNIIFNNNQTNGAEFFVATAKGQQSARDLAKNTEAMTKNKAWANIVPALGSRRAKKVLKAWAEDLQSVADTFRNAFGKEAMTVFYEAMGMVDLDLGFTNAARTLEEIQSKMEKFYKKLDKKYKGAATNQDGILSEGIVGYLIQNVPEKGEADSLAQRRRLLQQDIIERRKSGDEDRMQMADRIQELMQKLDGETVDQILDNLKREYPANYESLTWLKDELFPQYKDFLKQFDENFNDQANNYNTPNYLPIVYSNISPSIDLLQGKKKYYDSLSSAPKQSSYTIKRSDYTQLPLGDDGRKPKEIGLNLRRNAYNSLSDQITRAYTNPARQRIYSFLKTPESEEALGGAANRDFFAERIERLMESRERRGSFNKNTFEKAVDVLANLGRDIGTRIALAGSYQLIRQPADQVTVAIGVTGRADLMAKHLDPRQIKAARPVIDLFSIGRRGDASSGYKYINQMEGAQSRLERYYTEGNWVKAKEAAKNFADKFMAPLKVSDFTVAAATWMTFYRAYLAKNGIKFTTWEDAANLIKSDDVGHKRAAAYAENMTDIYQGSSDPTKMAVFAQKGKTGPENLLKAILVPFNSFGVQFRSRISSELTEIFTRSGDWRGKAVAVKDLGATIGGTIMFGLAKRFVLPAITLGGVNILYSIFGVDVEEPDEEKKKEEFELKWRQLQGDIVSTMIVGGGGQMLESYTIDGMNYLKYMIDSANGSEDVLDDNGEVMSFNKYAKERAPFYRYRSFDNAMSLGILDIGMDQAAKSVLNTKMVLTPEEMDKYTPEEQRFLLVALISDWLYLGGFNDADFARMWDKGRRDMINARKEEEKALKKIREGR